MSTSRDLLQYPLCECQESTRRCDRCQTQFTNITTLDKPGEAITDLTPSTSSADGRAQPEPMPLRTRLFQTEAIAFFYEKLLPSLWSLGLRQQGIEREGDRLLAWLREQTNGSGSDSINSRSLARESEHSFTVVDLSCGTGIMSRRLLKDTHCSVIALDYSEQMLKELIALSSTTNIDRSRLTVIRADVAALPLRSQCIDAIYSGAAMHCWPDAERAMAEIYRVLVPGGKLYLTTFLKPLPSWVFRFFTPAEIEQIAANTGFDRDRLQLEATGVYATLKAVK